MTYKNDAKEILCLCGDNLWAHSSNMGDICIEEECECAGWNPKELVSGDLYYDDGNLNLLAQRKDDAISAWLAKGCHKETIRVYYSNETEGYKLIVTGLKDLS